MLFFHIQYLFIIYILYIYYIYNSTSASLFATPPPPPLEHPPDPLGHRGSQGVVNPDNYTRRICDGSATLRTTRKRCVDFVGRVWNKRREMLIYAVNRAPEYLLWSTSVFCAIEDMLIFKCHRRHGAYKVK